MLAVAATLRNAGQRSPRAPAPQAVATPAAIERQTRSVRRPARTAQEVSRRVPVRFRRGSGESTGDLCDDQHSGRCGARLGWIDRAGEDESVGDRLSGSARQRRHIPKCADNDSAAVLLAAVECDARNAGRRRDRHGVLVQAAGLRRSRSRDSRRFAADL